MTQTKSMIEIERAARVALRGATARGWLGWLARHHRLSALAGYTLLTLLFTFPAIFHLGDAILGPLPVSANDNFWYVWYSWAFRRRWTPIVAPSMWCTFKCRR